MIYLTLIYEFFKIGLFAAGGGLATLPFLTDLSNKYLWLTSDMLSQMVAISESTPGPLGVNMATYAGYMAGLGTFSDSPIAGLLAVTTAVTATMALIAPSFIVILIVSRFLEKYKTNRLVNDAFMGLRPAVAGLIAAAAWSIIGTTLFSFGNWNGFSSTLSVLNIPEIALFAILMAITNIKKLKKLHPLVFIAFSAVVGVAVGYTVGW